MARIARHREKHPVRIGRPNDVEGYAEVEKHAQEILDKALHEEGEKQKR